MIITLCGGGSTFTPGIVKSIALRKDELDVDEIRLYDINEERQRKIGVLVDWILHEDLGLDIKLTGSRAQTWCKSVLRAVAASPDVTPS